MKFWRKDLKKDMKRVITKLNSLESELAYQDKYDEANCQVSRLVKQVSDLEKKLSDSKPSDHEIRRWEEAREALKKVEKIRQEAYNEGYADAYVTITNSMKPRYTGNPS